MKLASRFSELTFLQAFLGDNLESTQTRSHLAGLMSRLSLPLLSELAFNFDFRPDESHIHLRKLSSSSFDAISIAVHLLSQSFRRPLVIERTYPVLHTKTEKASRH